MSDILNRLRGLSSAEEFFTTLKVPFDQGLVNVNRLHILKKFNQHMARLNVAEAAPEDQEALCAQALQQAHNDFLTTDARQEKLFSVFRMEDPGFVPLSSLSQARHEKSSHGR